MQVIQAAGFSLGLVLQVSTVTAPLLVRSQPSALLQNTKPLKRICQTRFLFVWSHFGPHCLGMTLGFKNRPTPLLICKAKTHLQNPYPDRDSRVMGIKVGNIACTELYKIPPCSLCVLYQEQKPKSQLLPWRVKGALQVCF